VDGLLTNERRCVAAGAVRLTGHFREELTNDDLVMGDVLAVCRSGAVIRAAEPDLRTGEWIYRIEGRTADAHRIAVVFKFEGERAVFITVWKEK
jgi:molybdenum cofactor biosynthesis enzyme